VIQLLESAYDETIHWRRSCFTVSAGKGFVGELARLFHVVGDGSVLECIALKAVLWHVFCCYRSHPSHPNLRTIPLIWNVDYHSGMKEISLN